MKINAVVTVKEAQQQGRVQLTATSGSPLLDTDLILAHVLGTNINGLYIRDQQRLTDDQTNLFQQLLIERQNHKPLAYILGHKEFYGLDFKVNAHCLVPRPETELLVDIALELLATRQALTPPYTAQNTTIKVLDLGTGSGAIIVSIAYALRNNPPYTDDSIVRRTEYAYTAVDCQQGSLQVAKYNAEIHQIPVRWIHSNWFAQLPPSENFDLILANPPYIAAADKHLPQLVHEPSVALVSGEDGLDAIREIVTVAKIYLHPNGWLALEHGWQQGEAVRQLMQKSHYHQIETRLDLAGLERVTLACTSQTC